LECDGPELVTDRNLSIKKLEKPGTRLWRVRVPGLEQPEGLAARSSARNIPMQSQRVKGLSKINWRAFFVPSNMEIIQYEKYGIIYVTIQGRSETEFNSDFENAIRNIVEADNRRLLLDLSALQYLRSSALRVILNAVKVINRRSGKVVL